MYHRWLAYLDGSVVKGHKLVLQPTPATHMHTYALHTQHASQWNKLKKFRLGYCLSRGPQFKACNSRLFGAPWSGGCGVEGSEQNAGTSGVGMVSVHTGVQCFLTFIVSQYLSFSTPLFECSCGCKSSK